MSLVVWKCSSVMGKPCILELLCCFLCLQVEVKLVQHASVFNPDSKLEKQDTCAHLYLCMDMKGFDQATHKCLQMLCELMSIWMQQLVQQQLFPVSYSQSDMESELR